MSSLIWVLGLIGILRSELLPVAQQDSSRILMLIPRLAWYWWVLGILTFTLLSVMEGAYRIYTKKVEELNKELDKLRRIHPQEIEAAKAQGKSENEEKVRFFEDRWKYTLPQIKHQYETKIRELETEIAKLSTYKLKFEIDATRSKICVNGNIDAFDVVLNLYICFINSDIHAVTARSVNVLLMKRNEDNTELEIPPIERELRDVAYAEGRPIGPVDLKWEHRNLSIAHRATTLYHTIQGNIAVSGDYREILDNKCFLRVTMQAMNQKPYSLDFNVNWQNINLGWIDITPRTEAL